MAVKDIPFNKTKHYDDVLSRSFWARTKCVPKYSDIDVKPNKNRYSIWLNTLESHKDMEDFKNNIDENSRSLNMLALEKAAQEGNVQKFNRLAKATQWSNYLSNDLAKVIDLALSLDMVPLSIELAQKGSNLFPEDNRLKQAAKILSRNAVVNIRSEKTPELELSKKWLRDNASEYKGQWIAVRNGTLIGVALTVQELYKKIGSDRNASETIVVKVTM